ncbi:clathrin interactor 1-like isoform X2 [Actinia tenebrosa]|uniref:Clathrin interactor 1-like isoform X2 n=1 Tax=Actinia tenebrosa TaxID=6105 RepID=A0A6P8HRN4_ACTTE|nr:clathrin interactor 1-like isoform X2 [Actinia tenebrosa]
MWKIRELSDKMTNVVMNYSDVEAKVREATNDDTWGPHGSLMQEVARFTYTYEHFPEVMSMLWKRMLQENKKNWRRSYKALLLLGYLLRNGSERVVTSARDHVYDMRQLENFNYIDETGKDQGINIRHKVKEIIELIQDDERMRSERKRAKKNRDKYTGVSSDKFRDSHYSDRYDAETCQQDSFDEFNSKTTKKSKYREWRERTGSFGAEFRDSEEEGEEASEEKEKESLDGQNGETTTNRSIFKSSPIRKLDLGAAAHYRGIATENSAMPENPTISSTTSPSSKSQNSTSKDFFDFFANSSQSTQSPTASNNSASNAIPAPASDPFSSLQSSSAAGGSDSGFADFSQVSTSPGFGDFHSANSAPQPNNVTDDDFFTEFQSSEFPQSSTVTPSSISSSSQPVQQSAPSAELMGLSLNQSPLSTTNGLPFPAPMGVQTSMGMPAAMPMAMPSNQMNMPMSSMGTAQTGMTPSQPAFMGGGMMQPQMTSQGMQQPQIMPQSSFTNANAGVMINTASSTSNTSFEKPKPSTSESKATTWSNSQVDISLDSLIPTLKNDKPQQPSMNQLYSQQKPQMPYNSPQQQGAFNMGAPQMTNMGQMNYMYQPTGMGMMSNQGSMSPRMMPGPTRMAGAPAMMGAQPMGTMPMNSSQGFANSNSFPSYKGIS